VVNVLQGVRSVAPAATTAEVENMASDAIVFASARIEE